MGDGNSGIDWEVLIERVRSGRCTPFLGAGACAGYLPLGREIANTWATRWQYPLADRHDLARVSQFLGVTKDPSFPKEKLISEWFGGMPSPDFGNPNQIHRVLAELPFTIYITTNYDDFMCTALREAQPRPRKPVLEICRWHPGIAEEADSVFKAGSAYEPTIDQPVVFHLHGHRSVISSVVLTEDDYLDFLVGISQTDGVIPARIRRAFRETSFLFLGYSLGDWDFRVLYRSLAGYLAKGQRKRHVSVQLLPAGLGSSDSDVRAYLGKYFEDQYIQVYWGSCQEFAKELRNRYVAAAQRPGQ